MSINCPFYNMPTLKKNRVRAARWMRENLQVPYVLAHKIAKAVARGGGWSDPYIKNLNNEIMDVMGLTLAPKNLWIPIYDEDYNGKDVLRGHTYTYLDRNGNLWKPWAYWSVVLTPANLSNDYRHPLYHQGGLELCFSRSQTKSKKFSPCKIMGVL